MYRKVRPSAVALVIIPRGSPHTHVSAIERGVKLPTLLTVLRLAVALQCKATALVTVFDRADLDAIVGADRGQ